jgi:hypothetical protein
VIGRISAVTALAILAMIVFAGRGMTSATTRIAQTQVSHQGEIACAADPTCVAPTGGQQ